jgi:hypothetical protein
MKRLSKSTARVRRAWLIAVVVAIVAEWPSTAVAARGTRYLPAVTSAGGVVASDQGRLEDIPRLEAGPMSSRHPKA